MAKLINFIQVMFTVVRLLQFDRFLSSCTLQIISSTNIISSLCVESSLIKDILLCNEISYQLRYKNVLRDQNSFQCRIFLSYSILWYKTAVSLYLARVLLQKFNICHGNDFGLWIYRYLKDVNLITLLLWWVCCHIVYKLGKEMEVQGYFSLF